MYHQNSKATYPIVKKNSSKMVSLNQWAKIWEFGVQICSILNEISQFQVRSAFDVIDVIILYVTTFLCT